MRRFLDWLESRLRPVAIPRLTQLLVYSQVLVYALSIARPELWKAMALIPGEVLQGQWWRVFTVLATPATGSPVGPALALNLVLAYFYFVFFWMMGAALEYYWGMVRYNLYVGIGYLAVVGTSFLVPDQIVTAGFAFNAVFLAFAYLNPDYVIQLFFVLPVKIKWLARITWVFYLVEIVQGDWASRLWVLAAVVNFLLFFGRDIYRRMGSAQRQMAQRAEQSAHSREPFHRCRVCGITDLSHPGTEFRYCSQCAGTCGYCPEHLRSHEHVLPEPERVRE